VELADAGCDADNVMHLAEGEDNDYEDGGGSDDYSDHNDEDV
jgi:hypothetical protein